MEFGRLRGTVLSIFQIGKGGPQLKNNGGLIEARNASDAGLVIVRGGTPVDVSDLTTKGYVDAAVAAIPVAPAAPVVKRLPANAVSTATTYATITDLSFPIVAGDEWVFEFRLTAQCSATTGLKYQLAGPAGAIEAWFEGTTTSRTTFSPQRIIAPATPTTAVHTVANTPAVDTIRGVYAATASGTVSLQFASSVALATSTIFANAYLVAQRCTN